MMRPLSLALLAALACAAAAPAGADNAPPVIGAALVLNGETIMVNRHKIMLAGIKATSAQSRDALAAMIDGKVIVCTPTGATTEERIPARCHLMDRDLGTWMIQLGVATKAGAGR